MTSHERGSRRRQPTVPELKGMSEGVGTAARDLQYAQERDRQRELTEIMMGKGSKRIDPFKVAEENRQREILEDRRLGAIEAYGEDLGNAYFEFENSLDSYGSESEEKKKAFVEVVVNKIESGTHEEKLQAITTLVDLTARVGYHSHEEPRF